MTSVDRLARDLAGLRREVRTLATTPRLSHSSIDGGSLELRDDFGNTTGYVGQQFDGTFTVAPVGGSYPSTPTTVMVTPRPGGLSVYWDGTYDDDSTTRMDFKRVAIYAVPLAADPLDQEELDLLSPVQVVGGISQASGGEIVVGLPPIEYLIYAVTWTESGKFSPESIPAYGTPLSVVEQEAFDELEAALDELNNVTLPALDEALAARISVRFDPTQPTGLTENDKVIWYDTDNGYAASYWDGATWEPYELGSGAIAAAAIIAEHIAAGAIEAEALAADSVIAGKVAADAIDTRELKADAVTANEIAADAVVAGKIAADAIGAREILADSITATELQVAAVTADRLAATAVDGKTITGAIVRTAGETLPRIQIDSVGLTQYESIDGVLTPTTRIGSGTNKFTGSFTAEDIMVQGGLELYGQDNAFGPNSKVTLRTGQGAPAVAPTASAVYLTQTIAPAITPAYRQLNGYLNDGAVEYGVGVFFSDSTIYRGANFYELGTITVTKANGQVVPRMKPYGYTRIEVGGVQYAAVMGEVWDNGDTNEYPTIETLYYDDSVMNSSGTVAPIEVMRNQWSPAFNFNHGHSTGRVISVAGYGSAAKSMQVHATHARNEDTIDLHRIEAVGTITNLIYRGLRTLNFAAHRIHANEALIGVTQGNCSNMGMIGIADQKVWVINTTHQNLVFTEDLSVRITDQEWPVIPGSNHMVNAHGSISNNTLTYFGQVGGGFNIDSKQIMTKYSSWNWSALQPVHWFKFAWRGHSSQVAPEFLTTAGPAVGYAPVKRAWTNISMPPLPPPEAGQGAARDPARDVYGWTLYAGTGAMEPARTSLYRQVTSTGDPSAGQNATFGAAIVTNTANPLIATQGFPSLSPAQIISSAGDGSGPFLKLDGDGNIKGKAVVAQTLNGQTMEDTGWLDATPGTGWTDQGGTYGTVAYRKKNGIVYVSGVMKTTVVNTGNTTIMNLPAGFRPRVDEIREQPNDLSSISTYIQAADGKIYCPSRTTAPIGAYVSLSLSFPADN